MTKKLPKFKKGQVVAFSGKQAWHGYGRVVVRWKEAVGHLRIRWRYNVTIANWQIVDVAENEIRRLRRNEMAGSPDTPKEKA